MYWIIALSFSLIGTIIAWIILTCLWNKYDPIMIRTLPTLRIGTNMPGEYNYLDLKFSLLRHAFMFLVTAAIIFWVDSRIIIKIFLYGYGFYTTSAIMRYLNRKKILKEFSSSGETSLAETLEKPFKDSRVVVLYSICALIVVFILYGIRPY